MDLLLLNRIIRESILLLNSCIISSEINSDLIAFNSIWSSADLPVISEIGIDSNTGIVSAIVSTSAF